jgi:Tol biopolymer transport system component
LIDAEHGEARRFSQGSQTRIGGAPVWSPDGRRIAFNSNRSGRTYIYQRLVDEAGEEQLLYQSQGQFNEVIAWSPDGRYLISEQTSLGMGWDLWLISMEGKHEAIPYLRTRFNELAPAISPDGRYLAYGTDAGGKGEVYVRTFPEPGAEHLVVSMRGFPAWCGNNEILVMDPGGVWSVPVSTTPTFRAGRPKFLFRSNPESIWTIPTPSGGRFLQIVPEGGEALAVTVHLGFLDQIDR